MQLCIFQREISSLKILSGRLILRRTVYLPIKVKKLSANFSGTLLGVNETLTRKRYAEYAFQNFFYYAILTKC